MTLQDAVQRQFCQSLQTSRRDGTPYTHWLLSDVLPEAAAGAITALPYTAPVALETYGRRETNNASRSYFNPEARASYPVAEAVAQALQSAAVTTLIEQTCGIDLAGSYLRIEYCQDIDGFWLEPHTDIGVKRFTLLLYLSTGPDSESWGTDVLENPQTLTTTVPSPYNSALLFIPASNTWHAFHKRPISGVRKSVIVNYVGPEWRSRHELAFPDAPIARA